MPNGSEVIYYVKTRRFSDSSCRWLAFTTLFILLLLLLLLKSVEFDDDAALLLSVAGLVMGPHVTSGSEIGSTDSAALRTSRPVFCLLSPVFGFVEIV